VMAEAARLEVTEHIMVASTSELELGGSRDPRVIAQRLWPIEDVAARYQAFVDVYDGVPEQLERMRRNKERLAEADFLPGALIIGIKFQECFGADPLLPPELLPRPWPGRRARELLARSRRLGILVREQHNRPALFAPYDDIVDAIG
jgi:phenylacetic acid degradation operon negative regulatory protein